MFYQVVCQWCQGCISGVRNVSFLVNSTYVLSEWSLSKNKLFIRHILYQVSATMKVQLWPIDMLVKNNKWKILLMELIHKNEYLHKFSLLNIQTKTAQISSLCSFKTCLKKLCSLFKIIKIFIPFSPDLLKYLLWNGLLNQLIL